MRKFVLETSAFALLQILLIALLLWRFNDVGRASPFMPAINIKHERLRSAESPRLILVGGSNLLFGIDSTMIESQTRFHPVNMGLMRGLRLDYILNEIDRDLRAGDLVVICLEYGTLNGEALGNEAQVIMDAMSSRPDSIAYVDWPQIRQLLDQGVMEYVGLSVRRSLKNIRRRDNAKDVAKDAEIMQGVNAYGDLTRFHDGTKTMAGNDEQETLKRVNVDGVRASIARINAFVASCKARDVDVLFAWPPIPQTHFAREADEAERFHRLLSDELDAPVISQPRDMVFADDRFLNLSYHLRGGGVQERTQRLINAIEAARPGSLAGAKPAK